MTRPQTVQDVLDAVRRDRLVAPERLAAFVERHRPADAPAALGRLVADGLLTAFQAGEVAGGRGAGLWLGGYRVLAPLGKGGMGNVFLAEHAVLGRRVAVKALSAALRADPGARRRFVREARAAAALDHPNVVHVFDVDMDHDPPYLVMEYVDGVNLQAAVARAGTFAAGEAAAVGAQAGYGLARAAAVGLVHRDIKPANLLVDRRGGVKILDLGIVRFTQDDTNSRLHRAEVILGTIDYLAPEQAEDSSAVDPRADLYALGATLYFLLAGHPPFPSPDVRRKLAAKRTEDPPPIHRLRPDVPDGLSAVVHRLLARNPIDRFPCPAAAVAALSPWAAPGPDFPARLFRPSGDSTTHDRRNTDHEAGGDPLPETLCIVRPHGRHAPPVEAGPGGAAPPGPAPATPAGPPAPAADPPTEEIDDRQGADTDAGGAPTDEVLAVPPERLVLPDPSAPRARPRCGTRWRTAGGLVLAALAAGAGVAALVWLAGR
jgi:serine/threonine-protein kinase